ncbi:MAG: 16S rRNA (guanine(527)-N(7))-methyltransferase RsmG [Oscillospiraceae bacterium]|nr:16S rRNA (guanine(527)-N(7))-methyltransferase RsmG [Ruminococcus sp.]MCD8344397.1 16S rRNA (guanine(527)-N(7))-methyltransferase RsmG [Oscillospiraceae bacterium]
MAAIDEIRLKSVFSEINMPLSDLQISKFSTYSGMLVDKNKVINLTAVTDSEGIIMKHFADSVLPLTMVDIPAGASLIDVGTGAGFPGIPIKIVRDDLALTLLDSLNKRVNFLHDVSDALNFGATCIHSRAEDGARGVLRETFDIAVARAVARLSVLSEYCLPYVKVGGKFLALKGSDCTVEIADAKPIIAKLGGEIADVTEYRLPNGDGRTIVVVEKVRGTPKEYPRRVVK